MSSPSVAFFLFESRELSTYPTITNAARQLARAGYRVDIFLPSHMLSELPGDEIRLIDVGAASSHGYIRKCCSAVRKSKSTYSWYFAAYFEGLAVASLLQSDRPAPIAYLSMELLYENYGATLKRMLRAWRKQSAVQFIASFCAGFLEGLEPIWKKAPRMIREPFRRIVDHPGISRFRWARYHLRILPSVLGRAKESVRFSIVQDENREKVLRREFDFVGEVVHLPNSYPGFDPASSRFANERFGIDSQKKILLYSGAVEKGFQVEFFENARALNESYVLFANVYSRDGYVEELKPQLNSLIQSGRLFINQTLLSEEDYENLVRSSHICIAWYPKPDPADENMYYLGLSSGKINRYLASGKPVIVPDFFYGYRGWMNNSGIGVACSNTGEIPEAIKAIEANYGTIAKNVSEHYLENLEFEKCFQKVLNRLEHFSAEKVQLR